MGRPCLRCNYDKEAASETYHAIYSFMHASQKSWFLHIRIHACTSHTYKNPRDLPPTWDPTRAQSDSYMKVVRTTKQAARAIYSDIIHADYSARPSIKAPCSVASPTRSNAATSMISPNLICLRPTSNIRTTCSDSDCLPRRNDDCHEE
jgi:hypothetical protein